MFQHILAFAIQLYRWTLSPLKNLLFGPAAKCRFQPSCSEYALEAVKTHGTLHGSWLGLRRLCRCHPWGSFGYDPVPGAKKPLNMEIRNTVDVALGETIALKSDRALGPNNLDNHAGRPRPAWLSR